MNSVAKNYLDIGEVKAYIVKFSGWRTWVVEKVRFFTRW